MGAASAPIVVSSGFGSLAFFSKTLMPASTTSKPLSVGCPSLPLTAPPQSLKVVASVSAFRQLLALIRAVKVTQFWSVSLISTFLLAAGTASGSELNLSVISDLASVINSSNGCVGCPVYPFRYCFVGESAQKRYKSLQRHQIE